MKLFRFHKSFNSVVIGLVESGNFIPPEIAAAMTPQAVAYRSASHYLIALCECSQLRDAGLVATNVSPLVVDLTRPLPENPSGTSVASLYHQTTPSGQAVYKDVQPTDHQLRRDTFYVPFFQKMNAELDRSVEKFGSATLVMMGCDANQTGRKICMTGEIAAEDVSDAIESAKTIGIEIETGETDERPLLDQRAASDAVKAGTLTLSSDCFLDDGAWSDKKADQVREVLAKIVDGFSTNPTSL